MNSLVRFVDEVKQEVAKVAWSPRKETMLSVVVVFFVIFLFSLFFMAVDSLILYLVQLLLKI